MDPSELSAHDLAIVRAIAEGGSITAAATALGYSQPAVSQRIARLERSLGMPVVERVGRGVRLTEVGRILAAHAPAVASALTAALGEVDDLRGLRSGTVRIAGFPSASQTVLPRVLSTLAARHPGITVTYTEAEPPEAVAAVRDDHADLAITFSYPGDQDDPHGESARGLRVREVGVDELLLVVPAGGSEGSRTGALDIEELSDADWIAGCPRCRGHLLQVCGRSGFRPRIRFETDNAVAVQRLVAEGIGVATLPSLAIAATALLPGVVVHTLPRRDARTLNLVGTPGSDRIPAVAAATAAAEDAIARAAAEARSVAAAT